MHLICIIGFFPTAERLLLLLLLLFQLFIRHYLEIKHLF